MLDAVPDLRPALATTSDPFMPCGAKNGGLCRRVRDLPIPQRHSCTQSATMTHMEIVGIREMRQNLSRYTRRARSGESFVITDRGQAVAQLTPAPDRASVIDRLVAERGAQRGQGNLLDVLEELPEPILGAPSGAVLDELRGERV